MKLMIILQIINLMDFIGSWYLILYNQIMVEGNLLPNLLMNQYGIWGLVSIKTISAGLILILCYLLKLRRNAIKN
ncbi:MAG: hypothetical protein ACTSWL_10395 [Promethearchaeota archaeon]